MLEVLIGVAIFAVSWLFGFVFAYVNYSKPKELPKFEIHLPEIKIPEIVIRHDYPEQSTPADYAKLAAEYEEKLEKDRKDKGEEMTEDFIDLNSQAQNIMDAYLSGESIDES